MLAAILAVGVLIAVPRPDVVIQGETFAHSGCSVTATFSLVNQGPATGSVIVNLEADGTMVGSAGYMVPARGTVPGQIVATLPNCSAQAFALYLVYEPTPGG